MIDKTRITAASICDAIILDLSDETPKLRLEQKTRQVERLLISRSKAGCHVCLIIEEAHDLSVRILKLLKRFYEIEDGYKKALGIILIGQPELGNLFNEADHYDMREVIRRCQVAVIRGLNGNIKDYLALKFKRVGVKLDDVITDGAIKALAKRLSDKDTRGKVISNAYPLTINNYVTRAMNLAADMGESKVTEEVILAI
jgi:type II secretory pathway predicted ATPase ExeA